MSYRNSHSNSSTGTLDSVHKHFDWEPVYGQGVLHSGQHICRINLKFDTVKFELFETNFQVIFLISIVHCDWWLVCNVLCNIWD